MVLSTALSLGTLASQAISGIAGSIVGAQRERAARARQASIRRDMEGRNNSAYLADYYSDYLKRADSQNALRKMRDEMRRQGQRDMNTAVITGATPEATAARQYDRNRVMAGMVGNLGAMGEQFKQRAKDRYLAGANQISMLDNQEAQRQAMKGHNLMYNGLSQIGTLASNAVDLFPDKVK